MYHENEKKIFPKIYSQKIFEHAENFVIFGITINEKMLKNWCLLFPCCFNSEITHFIQYFVISYPFNLTSVIRTPLN
jgi:hypothetical protein